MWPRLVKRGTRVAPCGAILLMLANCGSDSPTGPNDGQVLAFRAADGHLLWKTRMKSIDSVLGIRGASEQTPNSKKTLRIHVYYTGDDCRAPEGLVSLDTDNGHIKGRSKPKTPAPGPLPPSLTSLTLHGPTTTYHLGRIADAAVLRAVNASTGQLRWTFRLPDPLHQAFKGVPDKTTAAALATKDAVYIAYDVDGRTTPDECDN